MPAEGKAIDWFFSNYIYISEACMGELLTNLHLSMPEVNNQAYFPTHCHQ